MDKDILAIFASIVVSTILGLESIYTDKCILNRNRRIDKKGWFMIKYMILLRDIIKNLIQVKIIKGSLMILI